MRVTWTKDGGYLARFRASPSKVRVSIRRLEDGVYMVTVAEKRKENPLRSSSSVILREVKACHKVPRSAILRALYEAEGANIEGIDLGMGSAYHHPQYRSEP